MTALFLEASKIKWRCRRGMLELDIFLIPFCENRYSTLTLQDQKSFVELLEENDVDLLEWLMARAECEAFRFNRLIKMIRAYRLGE